MKRTKYISGQKPQNKGTNRGGKQRSRLGLSTDGLDVSNSIFVYSFLSSWPSWDLEVVWYLLVFSVLRNCTIWITFLYQFQILFLHTISQTSKASYHFLIPITLLFYAKMQSTFSTNDVAFELDRDLHGGSFAVLKILNSALNHKLQVKHTNRENKRFEAINLNETTRTFCPDGHRQRWIHLYPPRQSHPCRSSRCMLWGLRPKCSLGFCIHR